MRKLKGNTILYIICVYRSRNSTIDNNDLLNQTIEDVSKLKGELLLLADFGYPNINWEKLYVSHTTKHCTSKFFTATQNSFLHRHLSTETHSRPNQRSTLVDLDDQSITNLIYASPLGKSHHELLKFNYLVKCSLNHYKIHYLYHTANFSSMKNDLLFIDWPQILDNCDTISC